MMHKVRWLSGLTGATAVTAMLVLGGCLGAETWTSRFVVDADELATVGRNPHFVLEPGHVLVLEGGGAQLTVTVLDETRQVDGVETRVVEERETKGGQLTEVARNYFAISRRTSDVFYFGEDVDMYKGGRVVNNNGSWLSGVDGNQLGLMMPARVLLGARYYQEVAPRQAMDRAAIVSLNETVVTPAGVFRNCLKVKETTPLEPFLTEYKYYAPGIGMVQDGALKLTKVVFAKGGSR